MPDEVIPLSLRVAAKRAFWRATASGYKATLSAGLPSAVVMIAVFQDQQAWTTAAVTVGLAVVAPVVAGASRYFGVIANGLPEEYEIAAVRQQMRIPQTRRELRAARGQG